MTGRLPGVEALELEADPAPLACPSVPTGESNGGIVVLGVEEEVDDAVVESVVMAVAVELTVVEAVVEGVEVEAATVVTGGVTLGAAVVPNAGDEAAVEGEVEAKILGVFALPLPLLSVEAVEPSLMLRAPT
jgi:hypothetical protein